MVMPQYFKLPRPAAGRTGVVMAALCLATALGRVAAQQVSACYVPGVGAVYLIGVTGAPTACLASSHVAVTIGGGTLADGSVTAVKLADGAVVTIKLADGSVTTAKLAANAVGTAQIADAAITAAKLASNAVGTAQIADAAVSRAKMAADAPVPQGLAAVSATGTLIRGLHVASVVHRGTGLYTVTFTADVNVPNGYYLVTPGLTGGCNTVGMAAADPALAPNGVFVSFADYRSSTPAFVDCAFSLVVF